MVNIPAVKCYKIPGQLQLMTVDTVNTGETVSIIMIQMRNTNNVMVSRTRVVSQRRLCLCCSKLDQFIFPDHRW